MCLLSFTVALLPFFPFSPFTAFRVGEESLRSGGTGPSLRSLFSFRLPFSSPAYDSTTGLLGAVFGSLFSFFFQLPNPCQVRVGFCQYGPLRRGDWGGLFVQEFFRFSKIFFFSEGPFGLCRVPVVSVSTVFFFFLGSRCSFFFLPPPFLTLKGACFWLEWNSSGHFSVPMLPGPGP